MRKIFENNSKPVVLSHQFRPLNLLFILLPLICQAQFKIVPDSLRCITPQQVNRHIEDAYTINQQNKSLLYLDSANTTLQYTVLELKEANLFCKSQINLHLLRNSNLQDDKEYLGKQLTLANRRNKLQKALIYIIGGVSVAELGYIAVNAVAP